MASSSLNVAPSSSIVAGDEVKWGTAIGAKRLRTWLREGPRSLRCASCIGGALVALVSFASVFSDFLTLHPLRAIVNLYLVIFGAVVVLLELTRLRACTGRSRMRLISNAGFLAKVWGRGAFLIFVGTLCIAQHETFHTLVGLFVTGVGVADMCVSAHAETKLVVLRAQLADETVLRAKFAAADTDGSGTLSASELAALAQELGSALSSDELERSIVLLDTDGDGAVSVDEFVAWVHCPTASAGSAATTGGGAGDGSRARTAPVLPPTLAPTPSKDGAATAVVGGAAGKPSFFAAAELKELLRWNTRGPCALHAMSSTVGCALLLSGSISCVVEVCGLDLFTALIDAYIAISGACIAVVEARRGSRLFGRFRPAVERNFAFLLKTWGRGVLLLFAGSLALGQLGASASFVETLNGLIGIAAVAVGSSSSCVGGIAAKKMSMVKAKLETQGDLRATFDRFDVDQSGTLDVAELGALCAALGQPLNHDGLEDAVLVLDSNRDGEIQYDEFVHWWQQGHDWAHDEQQQQQQQQAVPPGAGTAELSVHSPQSVGVVSV